MAPNMSLSTTQKLQLLVRLIDEAKTQADNFDLDSGVQRLEKLKESIDIKPETEDDKNEKAKEAYKAYFENQLEIFTGIVFNEFGLESTTELKSAFKKLLDPDAKKIKEFRDKKVFDFNKLSESIVSKLGDFISNAFLIPSIDLKNLRIKLNNLLKPKINDGKEKNRNNDTSVQGISLETFKEFVDFIISQPIPIAWKKVTSPRVEKKEKRKSMVTATENSFNELMKEIKVNNLYNLMYLLKGMDNPEIAQMLSYYFQLEDEHSKHLVRTLFLVEDSDSYCRGETMLIRAMSLYVNDKAGNIIAGAFTTEFNRLKINPTGDRSIKAYLEQLNAGTSKHVSNSTEQINPFYQLMDNVLSTIETFKPILLTANQELIDRDLDEKTHKQMIKFAFYMGVVSPIIKNIIIKMEAYWPENQKAQLNHMRTELSNAFMVLLGLVPLSKLEKNPLYTLAMDDELQKKVTTAFTFHKDAELQKKDNSGFTFHPAKSVTKERSQSFGSLDDHKNEIVKEKPPIDASVSDPVLSSGPTAQKSQGKILADQLRKRTVSVAPKREMVKPPSPKLTASQSPSSPASPKKTHFRENAGIFKPLNTSQKTEDKPQENNTNSPKKK